MNTEWLRNHNLKSRGIITHVTQVRKDLMREAGVFSFEFGMMKGRFRTQGTWIFSRKNEEDCNHYIAWQKKT